MARLQGKLIDSGMAELLKDSGVRADLNARAERAAAEARAMAPVETGAYRASILTMGATTDRAVARYGADVDYALDVEAKTGTLVRALGAAR